MVRAYRAVETGTRVLWASSHYRNIALFLELLHFDLDRAFPSLRGGSKALVEPCVVPPADFESHGITSPTALDRHGHIGEFGLGLFGRAKNGNASGRANLSVADVFRFEKRVKVAPCVLWFRETPARTPALASWIW